MELINIWYAFIAYMFGIGLILFYPILCCINDYDEVRFIIKVSFLAGNKFIKEVIN